MTEDGQPSGLISVLLDTGACLNDRDDAAMDLEAYSGEKVVEALLLVASSPDEDEDLVDSCLESLGGIWARDGIKSSELMRLPDGKPREFVARIIRARSQ